ncbi:hypothetical protein SmJEL517_g03138 [Synchytrium microbalum]|uniref:Cleavage and polyadenylation specificity factor subunit 2 n=1 Tax=Synchytrium microbalum TaxID=1806994 RepID=A0A507C440_9FUNG|nr:uncharacterized protein SmJEL517_g03138 [Synchytrium microbalum]TPX34148.1 hypothetical protein SmJEL517_g03138 [Synchytrium microbalum]
MDHLGAMTYLVSKLGLACPIYATLPVFEMGRRCMLDAVASRLDGEDFTLFTDQDVYTAFDRMTQLRFMQTEGLKGKASGIQITPYPAGHTVGGTIWKIKEDTNDIVYAVDYNHIKERHLDPTVLHQGIDAFSRPSVLITDAYNALNSQPPRRIRETALLDAISTAIQHNASVLIPVDSSTRVLEIAYILEAHWRSKSLNTPLFMLTHQSSQTVTAAKVLLEWMGESIEKEFSGNRDNPFEFKKMQLAHSLKDLDRAGNVGKIVLASMPGMDAGFSKSLFVEWATVSKNLIIITDRGYPRSMTRRLYKMWDSTGSQNETGAIRVLNADMNLKISKKVPLQGDELSTFREKEARDKENEANRTSQARKLRALDDDDESDDESELNQPVLNRSLVRDAFAESNSNLLNTEFDAYVRDAHRAGGFFKQSQSFRMFPAHESRRRVDDYGEQIDLSVFAKSEFPYAARQAADEAEAAKLAAEVVESRPIEEVIPNKVVEETVDIAVRCNVMYVDLEGRADGNSVRNIIPPLQARKLILIHGTEEATASLQQSFIENSQVTDDVYAPIVGEAINVSSSTNIYRVRLTDTLVSSLQIKPLDEYSLAYVTGVVRNPAQIEDVQAEEDNVPADDKMQVDSEEPTAAGSSDEQKVAKAVTAQAAALSETPVLDIISASERPSHHPVVIGEIKLSEFRRILENDGMQAEFNSGVLVVNRRIAVKRRRERKEVVLDGWVGEDYYRVRKRLYEQHAII